jgi:hypothetical protein
MRYPYCLYNQDIDLQPLFSDLQGDPYLLDLSDNNTRLAATNTRDQESFQAWLDQEMQPRHGWGFASYLERRQTLLGDCPQMVEEQRFYHLGVDIIVPVGTPLLAPLAATVVVADYEAGEGNYGGYVLLRHEDRRFDTFYSLYGHLSRSNLPRVGSLRQAGEPFAVIGDFYENGHWFYHTHLQIITESGLEEGYRNKGYCTAEDLKSIHQHCPWPMALFKR